MKLRGTYLKGRFNDLPNMIFFPEIFDKVENWLPFFKNPENGILNYRNVYILNMRNFGNSDRNSSFDMEDLANDVARFMWE